VPNWEKSEKPSLPHPQLVGSETYNTFLQPSFDGAFYIDNINEPWQQKLPNQTRNKDFKSRYKIRE
jgi:hypothetical protein